jgi:hypothetical protein
MPTVTVAGRFRSGHRNSPDDGGPMSVADSDGHQRNTAAHLDDCHTADHCLQYTRFRPFPLDYQTVGAPRGRCLLDVRTCQGPAIESRFRGRRSPGSLGAAIGLQQGRFSTCRTGAGRPWRVWRPHSQQPSSPASARHIRPVCRETRRPILYTVRIWPEAGPALPCHASWR